jgi:hypothetical protein
MNRLCPGWQVCIGERTTPLEKLLLNRVYKMYYSGTSDRGKGHDPRTRSAVSREHWRSHTEGLALEKLHDKILRGRITEIENWERYL